MVGSELGWNWCLQIGREVASGSSLVGLVVKDSALPLQCCGLDSWPGNFCMLWAWQKKKKKKQASKQEIASRKAKEKYRED